MGAQQGIHHRSQGENETQRDNDQIEPFFHSATSRRNARAVPCRHRLTGWTGRPQPIVDNRGWFCGEPEIAVDSDVYVHIQSGGKARLVTATAVDGSGMNSAVPSQSQALRVDVGRSSPHCHPLRSLDSLVPMTGYPRYPHALLQLLISLSLLKYSGESMTLHHPIGSDQEEQRDQHQDRNARGSDKSLNASTRSCDHSCMPQIAGRSCNLAPSWTAESTSDTLPSTIRYEIAVNSSTVPKKSDADGIRSSIADHSPFAAPRIQSPPRIVRMRDDGTRCPRRVTGNGLSGWS